MAQIPIPKALLLFGSCCLLDGCVTQARHQALLDEATSRERERADRFERRAQKSEQAQERADDELEAERDHAAELELELARKQQALDDAQALVDQLRNELGRVGGHLEYFGDRAEMADQLQHRVERLERQLATVMKLANRLVDSQHGDSNQVARVGVSKDGEIVIDVRTKALFLGKGSRLTQRGRTLLRQVAPLAGNDLGFSLMLPSGSSDQQRERTEKVKQLLIDAGAAEAAVTLVDPDPGSDEAQFRIRLGLGSAKPPATPASDPAGSDAASPDPASAHPASPDPQANDA